jgi:flagellar motor switch protein FliM
MTTEAPAEEAVAEVASGPREKKIKNYDFKRPDRFSKDQLRMIEMMHEGFARNFGTTLSTFIRTICEVKIISVKQSTYAEYVGHIATPSAISVFSVEPLKGNCLIEVTPGIIFTLIDRILGGPGNPMAKERELTDIEQVVVGKIATKALDNFRDTWQRIISFHPEIRAKETNPQFVQLVAPSEMVLVLRFEIIFKEQKGGMSICLPYIVLEPVIKKLSTQSFFTTGGGAGGSGGPRQHRAALEAHQDSGGRAGGPDGPDRPGTPQVEGWRRHPLGQGSHAGFRSFRGKPEEIRRAGGSPFQKEGRDDHWCPGRRTRFGRDPGQGRQLARLKRSYF